MSRANEQNEEGCGLLKRVLVRQQEVKLQVLVYILQKSPLVSDEQYKYKEYGYGYVI